MTDNHPRGSVPVLGEAFQERSPSGDGSNITGTDATAGTDGKGGKRRFFGLGKKKEDEKAKKDKGSSAATPALPNDPSKNPALRPESPLKSTGSIPVLTKTTSHPYSPASPARNLHSSSPAPPSPASSQIFERHVQEDLPNISAETAIPGHITTENHIPPVLDASSEAITNEQLNPDQVEIVMHAAHQPASVTVTGTASSEVGGTSPPDEPMLLPESEDGASNYGSLDSADVRRLSFISFADVVHAEHSHDTGSIATGMISPVISHNRSPSPIRSPLPAQGLAGSPNLSGSVSSKGLETSPNQSGKGFISPIPSQSPPSVNELTVETMRQALRKTQSGDLKSGPMSAASDNEMSLDPSVK